MEIISRRKAKELGLKKYFTGKKCLLGHISERHVINGTCHECVKEKMARTRQERMERQKIFRKNNPNYVSQTEHLKRTRNPEKYKELSKKSREKNRERINKYNAKYYQDNREREKERVRVYRMGKKRGNN